MGSTGGFGSQDWTVPQWAAERFLPPYLWRAPRPVIEPLAAAPARGGSLEVTVSTQQPVGTKLALARLGSVTHGNDMDQRYVILVEQGRTTVDPSRVRLTVQVPDAASAPPGDYMLFAVDGLGVPSRAEFVRLPTP
jgi:galactose oxidase